MSLQPRAVLVRRRSEYDELLARHGTRQHAEFFLRSRGRDLAEVAARHSALAQAWATVSAAVHAAWRRAEVERADLARFVFGPEDVVIVVGPDGLVANVAKYLNGQPVVGVDPEPGRNPGVLVRHRPAAAADLLAALSTGGTGTAIEERTMVAAATDDGEELSALNELYIGAPNHQSARYVLELPAGVHERQSSSGLLVGTGTGATGWLRSAWQERRSCLALPAPTDTTLCWFVREAWPSPVTGTACTEGLVSPGDELAIVCESDHLVCFGDGVEPDALHLRWGQRLTVRTASRSLRLVVNYAHQQHDRYGKTLRTERVPTVGADFRARPSSPSQISTTGVCGNA